MLLSSTKFWSIFVLFWAQCFVSVILPLFDTQSHLMVAGRYNFLMGTSFLSIFFFLAVKRTKKLKKKKCSSFVNWMHDLIEYQFYKQDFFYWCFRNGNGKFVTWFFNKGLINHILKKGKTRACSGFFLSWHKLLSKYTTYSKTTFTIQFISCICIAS